MCVWCVRRRCRKERLACVRTHALAVTREATVVCVYHTAMKSIASAVIERSRVLSTVHLAKSLAWGRSAEGTSRFVFPCESYGLRRLAW